MTFGVLETGFNRKRFEDLDTQIRERLKTLIDPGFVLDERTWEGNQHAIVVDELAIMWELLEVAYNGNDPDSADDFLSVALAALTGTRRKLPTKGVVDTTINLDASQAFAAGDLIAFVAGDETNRWVNRDAITSTTASNYAATFESEVAGSQAVAAAGTLTQIAAAVSGWNSITNAADATPGTDLETVDQLKVRRVRELSAAGSAGLHSIVGKVSALSGVLSVVGEENTLPFFAGGLPPNSFRIIVWDGETPAADDDEIAQMIFDSKSGGIQSNGDASGTATDAGEEHTVNFQRAGVVPIYVAVTVEGDVAEADVKAAIVAAGNEGRQIGDDVLYRKITCAAFIDGVTNAPDFTIGLSTSPTTEDDIAIPSSQIAVFDTARIEVTVA